MRRATSLGTMTHCRMRGIPRRRLEPVKFEWNVAGGVALGPLGRIENGAEKCGFHLRRQATSAAEKVMNRVGC